MDIRRKILEIQTSRDKKEFIGYFSENNCQINTLLNLITRLENYPLKEYASWVLVHLIKSKQFDLEHHYNDLVDTLFKTDNQTVLRNVTCCISLLEKTKYRESELIDQCICFISNSENKVALQVYSIYTLIPFGQKYPILMKEIKEIIEIHAPGKTAAYRLAQKRFINSIIQKHAKKK